MVDHGSFEDFVIGPCELVTDIGQFREVGVTAAIGIRAEVGEAASQSYLACLRSSLIELLLHRMPHAGWCTLSQRNRSERCGSLRK